MSGAPDSPASAVDDRHDGVTRRIVVLATPLLFYVAAVVHPANASPGTDQTRFVAVHVALAVLWGMAGFMLWFLVDGVNGPAASAVRVLILPLVVAETMYVTFHGIARGAVIDAGRDAGNDAAASQIVDSLSGSGLTEALSFISASLWIATVAALVLALRHRAPLPALVLMGLGGLLFTRSHVQPWGSAGMAIFLAGVVWLEFRGSGADATEPRTRVP